MPNNFRILPGGVDTTPLHDKIPPIEQYDDRYRNALESMTLALLAQGVPHDKIDAALEEALDAFGNNAPDPAAATQEYARVAQAPLERIPLKGGLGAEELRAEDVAGIEGLVLYRDGHPVRSPEGLRMLNEFEERFVRSAFAAGQLVADRPSGDLVPAPDTPAAAPSTKKRP